MQHELFGFNKIQKILLEKYHYILEKERISKSSIEEIAEIIVTYYEDIIDCMPGNVYWFDENLIAVGCNKNVLNMFGLKSLNEFKGLTFEQMGKIGCWSDTAIESFKKDTVDVLFSGELRLNIEEPPIPHNDGRLLYFLSNRVPIFNNTGKVIGVVGISIDITERKKMELQLIQEKARAEAAELKNTFMENMSHDFKTPLNGIYGVAQLLKIRDDLPDDVKNLIEAQHTSILRLNKLIQSVLDFDKISNGDLDLKEENINLLNIMESIAHNLSYQLKNKKINLNINYSSTVPQNLIGDSYAITSILLNLLSNAVKFTEKGDITVSITCLSQKGQEISLEISVADTGIGIPENKIEQIFERFYRLELSNKGLKEGHGIGLSVVKELVEKMNGKINVTSQLNVGSTFTVTLPFKL